MVDISNSHKVEAHKTEDILLFKDKIFHPASEWNYLMRRNMQEIIPGLFLGPYSSALKQSENHLLQQGITHIICVRASSEAHFIHPQFDENFTYLTLDIDDDVIENIIRFFRKVNVFINDAFKKRGKVLVHGNTGISRSATLVLAYVMETFNLSNMEALSLVKEKRGCINPNEGFASQLYEYEVIYKTEKFFANRGGSSKLNHTPKRKHVELEKSHMKHSQVKTLQNSIGRVSLKCTS